MRSKLVSTRFIWIMDFPLLQSPRLNPPPLFLSLHRSERAAPVLLLLQIVRQTMESDSSDLPLCRSGCRPTRPCEVATGPPAGAPTLNTVCAPTARLNCGQTNFLVLFVRTLDNHWEHINPACPPPTRYSIQLHEEPCKFMWLWYSRTGCPVSSINN